MKKKKLTINALAFGNLKNHKKQYAVMIVGIILAMVFSSSVIISIFSLNASNIEMNKKALGAQDVILIDATEELMNEIVKDGYVEEYGFAHMVGYASTNAENEENGFCFAWLDDTAKRLSYQSFIEGTYPTNENEIAIEKAVLTRLGIDAQIGDEISLSVFPQNGVSHIQNSNQKTYRLVGIADDKAEGISDASDGDKAKHIPSAFVCEGTETGAGGKESLVAYSMYADFDYPEYYIDEDGNKITNNEYGVFRNYISEKYCSPDDFYEYNDSKFEMIITNFAWLRFTIDSMQVSYVGIIGAVLALTSCIVIVNSFNSNIKERKQQIGMLRAVGTTRKQIIELLSREAFIISLISIPISLGVSYLLTLVISSFFGEDFVLTIDVKSVVVCGAVGLITVMLAALIPIIHATRITPMQAIRNIEVARKMKTKKIKTQKSFYVPKLLAKRSMAFHKGNQIAVSILLISTILFSCFGFSLISYEKSHPYNDGYDYYVNGWANHCITDNDKQNICAVPYVYGYGVKECEIDVMVDEFTDYFKIISGGDVYADWGMENVTVENYLEVNKSELAEFYSEIKSQAGYERDYFPTTLYAIDDWKLETLEDYLVSGEINLDKLVSGEEVIVIAPQRAAIKLVEYRGLWDITLYDEEIVDDLNPVIYGEYEYKVGDTIDFSMLHFHDEDTLYLENETIYSFDRVDKQAKIGAVISPNYLNSNETDSLITGGRDFGVLTSIGGMNKFSNDLNYERIYMYVDGEITDEIDEAITSAINPMLYKYNTEVHSEYQYIKSRNNSNNSELVAMFALIIIGFAICASLTNYAFTASIRERKRELGTLRAVGISRREFVESYVRQLLKTFALGYGLGFGIFVSIYLIYSVAIYFINQSDRHYIAPVEVGIAFNPWVTVAFCIILFGVCSINLWLKIRKEMKNSIIDNIREL